MPTSTKLQAVRKRYVTEQMALTQAAKFAKVPYSTARNWKYKAKTDGDDWDIARTAFSLRNGGTAALTTHVLDDFSILFQTTITELKSSEIKALDKAEAISRLSDAYVKTMKAAGNANPALSKLGIAMDVISALSDYIKKNQPSLLPAFIDILEPFGAEINKQYGRG